MSSNLVNGQAAILALIFGDKVASENFNLSMEIGGSLTHYSNLENFDRTRLGINFGISGNIKLSERFYLSPGVFFLGNRNVKFNNLSLQSSSSVVVATNRSYHAFSSALSFFVFISESLDFLEPKF